MLDDDIRAQLDRSFGDGPQSVSTDELISRGRRALRRRRLVTGAGFVAVVLVLGGTSVLAGLGADATRTGQVAQKPSPAATPAATGEPTTARPSPTPSTTRPSRAQIRRALLKPLAEYDGIGHLKIAPGATVVQRIRNPFAGRAPGKSVALALSFRGATYWFALYEAPDGSGSGAAIYSGNYDRSFGDWVAEQAPIADDSTTSVGPDVWPGIPDLKAVRFVGDTEELEPVDGATILQQRAHVSVGDSFAGPGDQTAAAKVRTSDGKTYYVLARRFDGKPAQYIAVRESDGGPTLQAFLDVARSKYAEGGGGLL